MPPRIKLNIDVRPDSNPEFYNLNASQQKYLWANWNAMRARQNRAAVDFPRVGEVTHRPWGGVTADPSVTVEPHLRYAEPNNELNVVQDLFNDPGVRRQLNINSPTGTALDEPGTSNMSKRQRTDQGPNTHSISDSSSEVSSMESNGTPSIAGSEAGGPAPGGATATAGLTNAAAENYQYVARPLTFSNKQSMTFNKVHRMLSYGIEFKILNVGEETFMCTSLLEVPWDRLFMYMSKSEFAMLPQGARATHCEIKIIQRNTRVAFEAGAALTGLATLNQNKFGIKALNLPAKLVGNNYSYGFDAANPMTPTTATEKLYTGYEDKFYGLTPKDANFSNDANQNSQPWHTLGIPFHFNSYFTMRSDNNTYASVEGNSTKLYPGWGNYSQHVVEYDMNAFIGDCVHQQSYTFNCAPLKKPVVATWPLNSNNIEGYQTHMNFQYGMQTTLGQGPQQHPPPVAPALPDLTLPSAQPAYTWALSSQDQVTNFTYDNKQLIEKSSIFMKGFHRFNPTRQPSILIGVKPIPKLTTISEVPSGFSDAEAWFEVSCTLHVSFDMKTDYPAFIGQNTNNDQILKGMNVRPEDAMSNTSVATISTSKPVVYGVYPN